MDAKSIFSLCCPHSLYCFSEISAAYEDMWHRLAPLTVRTLRAFETWNLFPCRKSLNPILPVRSWMMTELINRWVALCSIRAFFVSSGVNRRRWDPLISFRQTYPFLSYGVSNHGVYRGCLWVKVIGMFYLLWRGCVRLSWSPSCSLFYGFVGFLISKYACVSWNPMELNIPPRLPQWFRHRESSFDQILPWWLS